MVEPDKYGRYGDYGGKYVPEILMPAIEELEKAYLSAKEDADFHKEFQWLLKYYVGRPSSLYPAYRLTEHIGEAKIYLKREDLNHTGAHKINNTIGQVLLAKKMGKKRVIAETGAGQHGVATATACALLNIECCVYMGTEDIERQKLNVFKMELLGAKVCPVESGSKTLKDATNEAMRDWVTNVRTTYYVIGSVVGPYPYPMIVRDFQSVIGKETKEQILESEGRLPNYIIACVGGGSNAMGIFHPFYNDKDVNLIGVEAAGLGIDTGKHAASLSLGTKGVLHGSMNSLLQDENGQIKIAHSISAGLDYPGVGPEHCYYRDTGRAKYVSITDDEAIEAFHLLTKLEGIIPALESSHAIAYTIKLAKELNKKQIIIVNLSGRGDKDVHSIAKLEGRDLW